MIFLGIDCGTQSTKTIALDWESGEILASAQKAYGFVPNLPPGAMEQDPKDWIEAAEQSIGEATAKLGALKDEVRGIGVSGQQHGLVVLDQEDRVVRPAKLWNDTTTSSQCDQITDHFGGPLPASSRSSGTRCAQAIRLQRSCGCVKTSPRIGRGHAASCFLMIT